MNSDEENSVLAALRREPEQTMILVKVMAIAATGLVAWDVMAAWVLPGIAVKAVLVLLLLAYAGAVTHLVGRIMASSRHWASGAATTASKLAAPSGGHRNSGRDSERGVDIQALRRRPDELPAVPDQDEVPAPVELNPEPTPASGSQTNAFNESYFVMRLQEQVKDARRQGSEMCVASVHVTVPGGSLAPDLAENVAYEMALLASGQARIMSQPLALDDGEFVFSLPGTSATDTKQFVREIAHAFGDYWCYFGIAEFPHSAHDAQGLIESARAACEASVQSGKRGQVEYSAA